MATRIVADSLITAVKRGAIPVLGVRRSVVVTSRAQKCFHTRRPCFNTKPSQNPPEADPIPESMRRSAAPSGDNASAVTEGEGKHAAFLGEADSDDAFEKDFDINPEAHRHHFSNVNASGIHGQAGEGDEPIERERTPVEHRISDSRRAAYLGEADSDDAYETERIVDPEKFRHRIDDARSSGMHGQSGESDEPFERDQR